MRREIVALGLAGSVLLAGCTVSTQQNDKPEVAMDILPSRLPPAVAAQALRTVFIHNSRAIGSGVLLSNTSVLTAGHVLDNPGAKDSQAYDCTTYNVEGQSPSSDAGWASMASQAIGQADKVHEYQDDDIGLMRIPAGATEVSDISFASTVKAGDPVYFMNYQPHDIYIREPYRFRDRARPVAERYSQPAIYGGIVLGNVSGEVIGVATGLRSYGKLQDKSVHPGASGGAAYNQDGELIGEVTGYFDNATETNEAKNGRYGIRMIDIPTNTTISDAIVKLTPQPVVDDLRTRLKKSPTCQGTW